MHHINMRSFTSEVPKSCLKRCHKTSLSTAKFQQTCSFPRFLDFLKISSTFFWCTIPERLKKTLVDAQKKKKNSLKLPLSWESRKTTTNTVWRNGICFFLLLLLRPLSQQRLSTSLILWRASKRQHSGTSRRRSHLSLSLSFSLSVEAPSGKGGEKWDFPPSLLLVFSHKNLFHFIADCQQKKREREGGRRRKV